MLAAVQIPDLNTTHTKLEELRSALLSDPYFKDVPSMQPEAGKTGRFFHAKDDLPEVRREVFRLLPTFGAKVHVAIRRKEVLVAQARFAHSRGSKLKSEDIYDDLVKRLFKNLLHKADINQIYFARRGKAERREALEGAILKAKRNFNERWGTLHDRPTRLTAANPWEHAGLQVADYFLWAVQRLFERGEDRFFASIAPSYRIIMDIDDDRHKPYGEWYSDSNPLRLEKIKPLVG